MINPLLCFFIITHFLGDFYFHSDRLAQKARDSYRHLLIHSVYYTLVFIICLLPFCSIPVFLATSVLVVSHFVIDSCKFLLSKRVKNDSLLYSADQIAHFLSIITVMLILANSGYTLKLLPILQNLPTFFAINLETSIKWLILILVVHKPVNATIKQLTAKYRPAIKAEESAISAGAFIGTLERLIILLLLSVNQYSAIGLVLTAKSVARFDKIAKEQQFAEYYLLGTLLSTLFAITIYLLLE